MRVVQIKAQCRYCGHVVYILENPDEVIKEVTINMKRKCDKCGT